MSAQACDGIRVLDFSRGMGGAIATMMLADNGADVIKIEPPGGAPERQMPAFLQWGRGKRSVVLDLKTSEGVEAARKLAATADVALENFRPGVADRIGIGYGELSKENPGLVYCSITGFGPKGPYRDIKGYDSIVAAKSGRMNWVPPWEREGPVFESLPRMTYGSGQLAVQGILAALLARDKTGRGQHVQTSLLQVVTAHAMGQWAVPVGTEEEAAERYSARRPGDNPHTQMPTGYQIVQCKDGRWIQMASTSVKIFRFFMELLGLDYLYDDPGYRDMPYVFPSEDDRRRVHGLIREKMREKNSDVWMQLFIANGNIGAEPYVTTKEFVHHPQVEANNLYFELDDPRVGPMRQVGPIAEMTVTPSRPQGPSPELGEHTEAVLASLDAGGPWRSDAPSGAPSGPKPRLPLEGYTVLEMASYYAGPFSTTLLSEMGARVIKIEPVFGDLMRRIHEVSHKAIQGKESIALDLKTPEGREILYRIIARADALMQNFRRNTWKNLGLEYEDVQKVNPRLVYLFAASYGSKGPQATMPAFHPTVSAIAGAGVRMSGEGNPPMDSMQGDPDAAICAATALLLGLQARERTGKGQYMESRMIASGSYGTSDWFMEYEGMPEEPLPDSGQRGYHALQRLYQTSDGWVMLECPTQSEWQDLCHALNRGDLIEDDRFVSPESRKEHDEALVSELAAEMKGRASQEVEALLLARDVACVRADDTTWGRFYISDPQMAENNFRVQAHSPVFGGDYNRHGPTVSFSDMETRAGPPSFIGEQTHAIMAEIGYSEDETADLEDRGVIAQTDRWA